MIYIEFPNIFLEENCNHHVSALSRFVFVSVLTDKQIIAAEALVSDEHMRDLCFNRKLVVSKEPD